MLSRHKGLTLLEVVAALALLSTLLVAVLAAHDRLAKQTLRGRLRLEAIDAADALLAEWTLTQPMSIPGAKGRVKSNQRLYWYLSARSERDLEPLGVQVARLEVYDGEKESGENALATIEFLTTAAITGTGRAVQ